MLALLHIPMFGFTCLAFLLVCVVLAIATWILVRSGEQGTTKINGSAGCAIAFGLVCVALLMALGTAVVMFLEAQNEFVRRGPVKSFEFSFDDDGQEHGLQRVEPDDPDAEHGEDMQDESAGVETDEVRINVHFLMRDAGAIGELIDQLRELTDGDLTTSIDTIQTDEGEFTVLDVTVPIPRADLDEFKAGLREAWPDFKLPQGGKIELREPGQ